MATALTALATTTLASASATVTFSSISGSFRDLRLIVDAATSAEGNLFVRVNGDSGSNYYTVNMRGSGGGAQSSSQTTTRINSNFSTGLSTSDRAINVYDFMDYSATDKHKTVLVRANHPGEVDAIASRWASTSAITSIVITANDSGSFTTGSTFSLYGVSA